MLLGIQDWLLFVILGDSLGCFSALLASHFEGKIFFRFVVIWFWVHFLACSAGLLGITRDIAWALMVAGWGW